MHILLCAINCISAILNFESSINLKSYSRIKIPRDACLIIRIIHEYYISINIIIIFHSRAIIIVFTHYVSKFMGNSQNIDKLEIKSL